MTSLEALHLERPAAVLADTADSAALLADLVRLQTPPPLCTRLQPLASLQALCLQAVCETALRQPAAGPHLRLAELPPALARLAADLLFVALPPLPQLMPATVTPHTQLAWVRAADGELALRRRATLLRRTATRLAEIHFQEEVSGQLAAAFLAEYLGAERAPSRLRVLAGRPLLLDALTGLLSACPALTHLQCRAPAGVSPHQLPPGLTRLELETDVPVDLRLLDEAAPALQSLRLRTWYRCAPGRRPLLLSPVETGPPLCPRLAELEVTGYRLGGSLQSRLPALRRLALRRCSAPLGDLFRHQELRRVRLQNIESAESVPAAGARLPAVTELDLHTAWGGRRLIDLAAVTGCFPALETLTLRPDYYGLVRGAAPPAADWFPRLAELTLLWLTEQCAPPAALLSERLPLLRRLVLRRRCWLFADLLAAGCPALAELDLHSSGAGPDGPPLPTVRRLVARLCSAGDIADICRRLPKLEAVEIHLGYLDHSLADGYLRLVDELTQRGIEVTVLEN